MRNRIFCLSLILIALSSATAAAAAPDFEPVAAGPHLVFPELGAPIPQNSVFVFYMQTGFDREESFVSARINGEEPVVVDLDREACSFRTDCTGVVGPFPLNAGDELVLEAFDVDAEGSDETWRFIASDFVDVTAPVIAPPAVDSTSIQGSGGTESYGPVDVLIYCRPEKVVRLEPQLADDDALVGTTYLVRVNGSRERVVSAIWDEEQRIFESFSFDELGDEHCYRFVAWDVAGNRGESELTCFDFTIQEDEAEQAAATEEYCADLPKPRWNCTSSKTPRTSAPWALAWLTLGAFAFRRRQARLARTH